MTIDTKNDRREYFRIDDAVKLRYREVPIDELDERIERLESEFSGNFNVMSSLTAISQRMVAPLHRLETKSPDIAECLRALDSKIDTLGRAFLAQEADLVSEDAAPVNISAGGISFTCESPVVLSTLLEIRLLLLPSFTGLLTYGEVVGCDKSKDESGEASYLVRVGFTYLRDGDRDALIRHILRRQGDILRERRKSME